VALAHVSCLFTWDTDAPRNPQRFIPADVSGHCKEQHNKHLIKIINEQMRQINTSGHLKKSVIKILTTLGSIVSIGFGIWHFFVPCIWNWYSYFDKAATELVIAVRAINIFFSLLLILIGIANILFVFRKPIDRFSTIVLLSISAILWTARFILQIVYPQGSQNPFLQYSMLCIFILVMLCFTFSLGFVLNEKKSEEIN